MCQQEFHTAEPPSLTGNIYFEVLDWFDMDYKKENRAVSEDLSRAEIDSMLTVCGC